MSNEFSTQSAYYILYTNEIKNSQLMTPRSSVSFKTRKTIQPKETPNSKQLEDDAAPLDQFWEDFTWTEEEKIRKKKALDQNLTKCDIVENLPPGRGDFLVRKYDEEADSYWNKFYSSHRTNFFKDRHYLQKTFPDEFGVMYGGQWFDHAGGREDNTLSTNYDHSGGTTCEGNFVIVEIGCGVGNTVLPLLELKSTLVHERQRKKLIVWGVDFSKTAVDLLREDERFIKAQQEGCRARAAVWDITKNNPNDISRELDASANISLLLFCLSAIAPDKMPQAARNVAATLKPGGMLLLRDYGRYDEAQLKLGMSRAKRISENFYVKHDGTRCYYFELSDLEELFGKGAGLEVIELKYIQRTYTNRSKNMARKRVWVQGRFRKSIGIKIST